MRRVSVVGASGSGKTTLARELARRLGPPFHGLDHHFWGPSWTVTDPDAFRARVSGLVAGDAWAVDGDCGSLARDLVWAGADAAVRLDLPRLRALLQVMRADAAPRSARP